MESRKAPTFNPESSSSTPCLMEKGAKVTECYLSESTDDESGEVQNMLDESDDMLGEEMDRTQTLTDNLQRLQSKFDNLQSHHNTLLADHEKLFMNFFKKARS